MHIPENVRKMKLKSLKCRDCRSFEAKHDHCFMTRGKAKADDKACDRIRLKKKEGDSS